MAASLEEKTAVIAGHVEGKNNTEIGRDLGMHRKTVGRLIKSELDTIAKHQEKYMKAALDARIAVLTRLAAEIEKPGSKLDSAKVLSVLDASVERDHKMRVGFYISPEKLELALDLIAGKIQSTCSDCPRMIELAQDIQGLDLPE